MSVEVRAEEGFAAVDVHFARLLERLAGGADEALTRAARWVSRWTRDGHSCLDLRSLAASEGLDAEAWLGALRASPLIGRPGEWRPLILDEADRLYLYRYWAYEAALAHGFGSRAGLVEFDRERLREQLASLFAPSEGVNWQKVAAATAAMRRFCVISGGPGTGKTYTVVRILALLAGQNPERPPVVALAAPTGKAAARMQDAIRAAKAGLAVDETTRAAIPEQASTIHRLLGVRPNSTRFRHHRGNPLPIDVLVVDEASMVDLALMAKLVDALPAQARLILLGDRDQLASVEAGSVLADICAAGEGGCSRGFAELLAELTDEQVPAASGVAPPLADAVMYLRESRRFRGDGGIGRLARLVNEGEAKAAAALLTSGEDSELGWRELNAQGLARELGAAAVAGYRAYLQALREGAPEREVFTRFEQFRILCAHRGGPAGVESLNREVERALAEAGLVTPTSAWYLGRPLMITNNDHALRLYNGDIGIILPCPEGPRACFPTAEGVRRLHPARLPPHESVYAMTVHKTQGSEFDHVLLVLPDEDSRVLNRKLLYTGITRARQRVELWGSARVLRQAAATAALRGSGLAARLREAPV